MGQDTIVLKLDRAAQERLRAAVRAADFELRNVDHAHFSARADGVVATLYRSGKLVVQGRDAELFVARHLEGVPAAAAKSAGAPGAASRGRPEAWEGAPLIGGDESGKGDYFGPLVVAAVRIGPEDEERLREGGVADSKKVADSTALRVGPALRERFPHALRVLDPPEYNRRHTETGNVAILLSEIYREVVEEIAEPGDHVLIDQFSKDQRRLSKAFEGLDVRLHQRHRAEQVMAVAAASLIAREAFLVRLGQLSEEVAVTLPKGAGPPVTLAGREFLRVHSEDELGRVAKVHFKTTRKLR